MRGNEKVLGRALPTPDFSSMKTRLRASTPSPSGSTPSCSIKSWGASKKRPKGSERLALARVRPSVFTFEAAGREGGHAHQSRPAHPHGRVSSPSFRGRWAGFTPSTRARTRKSLPRYRSTTSRSGPMRRCRRPPLGAVMALADKMDSLIAFFSVGHYPYGQPRPLRPSPTGDRQHKDRYRQGLPCAPRRSHRRRVRSAYGCAGQGCA